MILGRSRYVSLDRKVAQKALDLGFAHGVRMALPMEQDEPGLQGCNCFWEVQDLESFCLLGASIESLARLIAAPSPFMSHQATDFQLKESM